LSRRLRSVRPGIEGHGKDGVTRDFVQHWVRRVTRHNVSCPCSCTQDVRNRKEPRSGVREAEQARSQTCRGEVRRALEGKFVLEPSVQDATLDGLACAVCGENDARRHPGDDPRGRRSAGQVFVYAASS
jgi:hypothetical protein